MRISRVYIASSRLNPQEFDLGSFTVMFGKNNAGKTNLLEDIYVMLATQPPSAGEARIRDLTAEDDIGRPVGGVYIELEPGLAFDDAVLDSVPDWEPVDEGVLRFSKLPLLEVCYASADREQPELWFTNVREFYEQQEIGFLVLRPDLEDEIYEIDEQQRSTNGPFPEPLFLGWEFNDVDTWVTAAMDDLTAIHRVEKTESGITHYPPRLGWLEPVNEQEAATLTNRPIRSGRPGSTDAERVAQNWHVRSEVAERLDQLAALSTDLLPDFLDGSIRAEFRVPAGWRESPQIRLSYCERPNGDGRSLEYFGRGASRWMGIAVQIALRLMNGDRQISGVAIAGRTAFAGQVLFIDEPEAHLHHSAVGSIVRWCHRMVSCGFNIIAASHHEEFLRASGDEVTFVKVTRDFKETNGYGWDADGEWNEAAEKRTVSKTTARTVPLRATSTLQELANEIGLHPAAALSLQRAVLFVEGTLDEAMLDEYASPALDAAGVIVIPIHGTKNLEGLIDGEFTTRLGIKIGVLTDNTNPATIWDRSNNKRSGEEIKLARLITRFKERGLAPPTIFGVPEDDLLFALPADAIRKFLGGPFPGWHELRDECRAAGGRGKSDSVDWKSYALEKYGLPITTGDGVRRIIRALGLAGVSLPSLRTVVDEIIDWAAARENG